MRLTGMVLVAATWMGFQPSVAHADVIAWSTNAAACVPVSASGLSVTAGAVTAGGGVTATLYCGITKSALPGGFDTIEIIYKGGAGLVGNAPVSAKKGVVAIPRGAGFVTSELIEMLKATGAETVKCGIKSKGSSTIVPQSYLCENSEMDFEKKFYYLRIVLNSGLLAGQLVTIYGSSLVSTR